MSTTLTQQGEVNILTVDGDLVTAHLRQVSQADRPVPPARRP